MYEPHVEHPVGFVEDEDFDVAEVDVTLLHQVDESTRRRDEDIDAATEGVGLWSLSNATEDDRVADVEMPAVLAEAVTDLRSELTGRCQYQGARFLRPSWLGVAGQEIEDRQGERGGLARPGLRDSE